MRNALSDVGRHLEHGDTGIVHKKIDLAVVGLYLVEHADDIDALLVSGWIATTLPPAA